MATKKQPQPVMKAEKSATLAGIAMVLLGGVGTLLSNQDYLGASIAGVIGLGILVLKYRFGF